MSVTLRQISLREIQLELKEPFRISSGTATTRRIMLLELVDVDGTRAWSECVAGEIPNYTPETIDTCWLAITKWIAPALMDTPIEHPSHVHEKLERNFRGHQMAKAAVEMGMWAIESYRQNKSLAEIIGGTRTKVAAGVSLGIQDNPQALVEKATAAIARGYQKVKLKIMPGADVQFVGAVREALGKTAPLMADANNAYTLADIRVLEALDQFGLIMIEQPLAWDDIVRHAELQKKFVTPICLDESITSIDRAEDMLTLSAGRIINIKPARVGGFSASIAIHDLCEKNNVPVWCGGMLESGIGRGYNVALASLPNFRLPGDISPSDRYWARDIVTPEWTMDTDGLVTVPRDQPGIGTTVNVDLVDDLTQRHEILGR